MYKNFETRFYALLLLILLFQAAESQGTFIENLNGEIDIYYEDTGTGQPIIFIPGWTMTSGFFKKQTEYFKSEYRVISYDPRSQGRSKKTMERNTYKQHARDLKGIIDSLGISETILVGWSSGCLTIFEYLDQFGTDRIKQIVFIDETPKWIGDPGKEWVYGSFNGYRSSLKGLLERRPSGAYGIIDWMLDKPIDSLTRNWMVSEMIMTPNHAALSLYIDGMASDYTDVLRNFDSTTPALFLLRESWFDKGKSWLKNVIPSAEIFPISSHAMFWEHPEEFNLLMEQFFEKNK